MPFTWSERFLVGSLVAASLSELAGSPQVPGYNFALACFGIYAINAMAARTLSIALIANALTLIWDIVWCSIWGKAINQSLSDVKTAASAGADVSTLKLQTNTAAFGLAFLIINMFLKTGFLYFGYKLLAQWGGPNAAQTPGASGAFPPATNVGGSSAVPSTEGSAYGGSAAGFGSSAPVASGFGSSSFAAGADAGGYNAGAGGYNAGAGGYNASAYGGAGYAADETGAATVPVGGGYQGGLHSM